MLEKLTVIVGEIQVGNTSVKMGNMGKNILDALLSSKNINKLQYQRLVKKLFSVQEFNGKRNNIKQFFSKK